MLIVLYLFQISNVESRLHSLENIVSSDPANLSVTSLLVVTAALESLLDNVASNANVSLLEIDTIIRCTVCLLLNCLSSIAYIVVSYLFMLHVRQHVIIRVYMVLY